MAFMTWTEEQFGTTVPVCDDQHRTIFGMVNSLVDAVSANNRSSIGEQLDALINFVVMHFHTEERMMQEKNYPDFPAHKAEHDKLVSTCADLQKQFHAGQAEVTAQTAEFVRDWLVNHIPKIDKRYGPTLR